MSKKLEILLVTDNSELTDYFDYILFKNFDVEFETVVNVQDCLNAIEKGSRPDLIILELPQEQGLQEFFDKVDTEHHIPVLFTADDNHIHLAQEYIPYHPSCGKISYNLNEMVISSSIKRMLKIAERSRKNVESENEPTDFMELPITLFLKSVNLDYDLYLKMGPEKFIKVYNGGDKLEASDFQKYADRKVRTVFLKPEDYVKASLNFSKKMEKALEVKKLRVEQYTALSVYSIDKVNKVLNKLGLREEVLVLANQALELTSSIIEKNKGLSELLAKTLSGKNYISEHTLLLSFITTSIAKYMGWPSISTCEKLTLASFFHDMCLDGDELAKIDQLNDEIESHLHGNEILAIKTHPQRAVDVLSKFDGIPPDVDKIILQHHENGEGTGFPRSLEWKRVYSLAAVFIVAEDFTRAIFECGLNEINVEHILNDLEEKYSGKGNFALAVDALKIAMGFSKPEKLQAA